MIQICLNMLYINMYSLKWKNYQTHLNNVNGGYSKLEQRRWVMQRQWHAWKMGVSHHFPFERSKNKKKYSHMTHILDPAD
ncbi:hypothetical protein MKW92_045558 [Papaver armeniacum]|nr:hypothetical protein MKW92_045558 [Papaver armeniacum]